MKYFLFLLLICGSAFAQTDGIHAAVYQGGLTVTGNPGDTVLLTAQGSSTYAAQGIVRLTATDAITVGTPVSLTSPGSGYLAAPVTWTAATGSAASVAGAATTTTTMGVRPTPCPIPYDGTPCINTYPTAPTVFTLKAGTLEVTIWAQTIAPGSIQVAACNTTCAEKYNGPLIKNEVLDLSFVSAFGGVIVPGQGVISWVFAPQISTPDKVSFSAAVMSYPTGTPVQIAGVF